MVRSNNLMLSGAVVFLMAFTLAVASIAQQPRSAPASKRNDRSPDPSFHRPAEHQLTSRQLRGVQSASFESGSIYEETLAPGVSSTMIDPERRLSGESWQPSELEFNGCDSCGMTNQCCCNPIGFLLDWSRADVWVGVTSFSGGANFLTSGSEATGQIESSTGFQEGFNFGSRLPGLLGGQIGSQLGLRVTQTQLDGSTAGNDNRNQLFLTTGLFRRVDYGVQGGLVIDYMHDDWVYQADLVQLRGELSFLFSPCHDLGFRFTDNQQVDDITVALAGIAPPLAIQLAALNNYRFFYRYRFSDRGRGLAELQAGFTEDSGAVLGVSLKTPLQGQLGLETSATYVMPPNDSDQPFQDASWNLGMAVVWTPGRAFGTQRDYYRPLLDVADNGSFLTRLLR